MNDADIRRKLMSTGALRSKRSTRARPAVHPSHTRNPEKNKGIFKYLKWGEATNAQNR